MAFIYHWQPDWLLSRPVSEIADWQRGAVQRFNDAYGEQQQ